jgi:hypothetical protein
MSQRLGVANRLADIIRAIVAVFHKHGLDQGAGSRAIRFTNLPRDILPY